ncbi:MFS transporter [Streptomyces hiroshimensis]|uniref:MFS transporter n=1 Tax=Streptomyces hiroshimensis TaxID=66424 RepID=A0ABQ2YUY3_9ACTN|nr:MFS transporter [Streptomyces hiroshimensis]GGX93368.1 MFS transporter [Streptomyces hiroshimensis]
MTAPSRGGHGPAEAAPAPAPAQPRSRMFASLAVRNYRYFFFGQFISNSGTWMQFVAQDWLVFHLTGSTFAVGVTTALQFLPVLLFGLFGGVVADRYPKRRILLTTQGTMGLLAAALAVLTLTDVVVVAHVYVFAFLLGLMNVFANPAIQTFVPEMVGPERVANAVSLGAVNFQSARLLGPAAAGPLIVVIGSGWAFALNALSYVAVIASLLAVRVGELRPTASQPREKGQIRAGLRHVREHPELVRPIVLVGFVCTFGFNFPTLLSGFAYNVFDGGAKEFGFLTTAVGLGALAGALMSARRRSSRTVVLVGTAAAFGALEAVTALAPSVWLFGALMVLVGLLSVTFSTTANSLVQLNTDPAMRGRVMGLYMLVYTGGTPVGGPVVGWAVQHYGARAGILACGLVAVAAAAIVGLIALRAPRAPRAGAGADG